MRGGSPTGRQAGALLGIAAALAGCREAPPGRAPVPAPAPPPAPKLEPYTEQISGTALSFEMVPVEGGRVTVPVDGGDRQVEVASFWIARTETTWDLYDVFVYVLDAPPGTAPDADAVTRPSRPYVAPDLGYGHGGYAAISVAAHGAEAYGRWLSGKTGRHYRLPTEAEWRLACRRSGIAPAAIDAFAWHAGNADGTPHSVAAKQPDALGLYDLYGNVREWCTAADGSPLAMGGSFRDPVQRLGCAAREIPTAEWQVTDPQVPKSIWWLSDADFVGFRIVCIPGPAPGAPGAPDGTERQEGDRP